MLEFAPRSEDWMTYNEAILYCQFCNHNGYTDWRMPTRPEYRELSGSHSWYIGKSHNPIITAWRVIPVRDI